MNESYHISSFRSLCEFTDKLPFLWHLLIVGYQKGKKIEIVARSPYFSTWTLCFYKERSVFRGSCRQVVYCLNSASVPRQKNDISGYIWPRAFTQMVKCSLLDEKIVYQSFYGALLLFSYFLLQGKVLCFARVGKLCAICLLSKGPVIRATFFFNLSCNIVAVQVETRCCAYYHLRDQLVPQQNILLQISGVLRLWLVSHV